jgi:amicyanin
MKDQKKLMFAIVVVAIVIVGGVIAAGGNKKDDKMAANTGTSTATSDSKAPDTSKAVATMAIEIKDYMFGPAVTKVKVGDTITWTNQDAVRHNIVADKSSADAPNGPLFARGETFSFKFTKAGTYTYHCDPHPYMHGTVVVE